MKISSIEKLKTMLDAQERSEQDFKRQENEADNALEQARLAAAALISKQLDTDTDMTDEIARANARVSVAKARLQRVRENKNASLKEIDLSSTRSSIKVELDSYIREGLIKDMSEKIGVLQETKNQYFAAVEDALIQYFLLERELQDEIRDASYMLGTPLESRHMLSPYMLASHGLLLRGSAEAAINEMMQQAAQKAKG